MPNIEKWSVARLWAGCFRSAALAALCAGMMANSALATGEAAALSDPATKKPVTTQKKIAKAKKHYAPAGPVIPTDPVYKGVPAAAVTILPCSAQSAAELNKTNNIRGWNIPAPNFADSISQDRGCWRTELAKYGFSFLAYSGGELLTNVQSHYVPPPNQQQYLGQRTTAFQPESFYLMYDLSRYGIPDGQFVLGGVASQTTWDGAFPSFLSMNQLSYYQTFADKKLEFNIGYIPFLYQFVGPLVGGNIFNVLGPAATIPVLMGASSGSGGSPSVILNWHITDRFYDKAAVIRSDPTTSVNNTDHLTAIQLADYTNPTNFKFADAPYWNGVQYPAERALFVNEFGYKNAAAPGDPFTWIRVTGMYNTTKFENYQNPTQQTTNAAILGYADRQIWQSEPGDRTTAYRGVYVGGTASWASPQATAITQDYQFRLYELGMFGRPKDQLSFIWERTVYSPYIVNPINSSALCSAGALCAQNYTNQFSLTYNVNVMPGIYTGIGVAYVDHPALTYSPNAGAYGAAAAPVFPQYNINHAVNFLASLFINL